MVVKYTKILNYVLNQNVNVTKRARFATFTMSIVDNYAYCRSINGTQSMYDRAAIDHQHAIRIQFHDHS